MAEIMMPVVALNEDCKNCPELNIDMAPMVYYDKSAEEVITKSSLRCSNYERCMHIYNRVKKDWEENHVTKLSTDIPSDPLSR